MPDPNNAKRPVVLYIGGSGRSGSTLLECLVAELPGVAVLGEVAHLFERGVVLNELCACGRSFSECPFWSEVGILAFGGWDRIDIARIRALKGEVDRQRRMLETGRRHPSSRTRDQAREYAGYFRKIYDAASDITGAGVVVDSSKVAPTALALSHEMGIDLRVLHIVRDPRGVAYSWSKQVARPETGNTAEMPRLSSRSSSLLWLSHNLSIGALAYRGVPVTRIRYEDLLADVDGTVRQAWRELALPGSAALPLVDPSTIELHATHSVAGNPMRFKTGLTHLRTDDEWKERLPSRERRLVTALTYPALKRYRYA
ncbi:MAG: sulfotransferase [Nocardioidaceae bacterium]|nr:MAG: sulfotransferase [Nocardioidaceae bacterium]